MRDDTDQDLAAIARPGRPGRRPGAAGSGGRRSGARRDQSRRRSRRRRARRAPSCCSAARRSSSARTSWCRAGDRAVCGRLRWRHHGERQGDRRGGGVRRRRGHQRHRRHVDGGVRRRRAARAEVRPRARPQSGRRLTRPVRRPPHAGSGAQVVGQTKTFDSIGWTNAVGWAAKGVLLNRVVGFSFFGWIVQTAFFLVLALVAAALMPRQLRSVQRHLGAAPWASLGWGALLFFIVLPADPRRPGDQHRRVAGGAAVRPVRPARLLLRDHGGGVVPRPEGHHRVRRPTRT